MVVERSIKEFKAKRKPSIRDIKNVKIVLLDFEIALTEIPNFDSLFQLQMWQRKQIMEKLYG